MAAMDETALAPKAHGAPRFDHRARHSEFTLIRRRSAREWTVTQRLLDPEERSDWSFDADVDLRGATEFEGPLLQLRRISE